MRACLIALILVAAAACGDDTSSPGADLSAACLPLTSGDASCPKCYGASVGCGSEQQGFTCQYGAQYCLCSSGSWTCSSHPLATADLSAPLD
jgi:hypothetical protein